MKKPASGVKDHKWKPKKEGTEGEAISKGGCKLTKTTRVKARNKLHKLGYQKNIDYDTARHAAKTKEACQEIERRRNESFDAGNY